ncbi:hypothetical protein CWATWH0402_1060, partial [Crocosphaera watsonii WH 0402]
KKGLKYLGEHLNGSVGHTQTGASCSTWGLPK